MLPMSNELIETLRELKEYQDEQSVKYDLPYTDENSFVFCNRSCKMRTYYGTRDIFEAFLKRNNLKDLGIHFHAIRHTFGEVLKENGWSIYDIQKMLRHAKTSTTEHYLGLRNNPALDIKKDINDVFANDEFIPLIKQKNGEMEM